MDGFVIGKPENCTATISSPVTLYHQTCCAPFVLRRIKKQPPSH
jgi:hypothetical protein